MKSLGSVSFAIALLISCSSDSGQNGDTSPYSSKDLWLCRPDLDTNQCAFPDLTTTEIHADGTRTVVDGPVMNSDAPFDCFIVHSTGNPAEEPGNIETLSPTDPEAIARIRTQAVWFRESCRIFAPQYHRMNIGTYAAFPDDFKDTPYFERAYDDVAEAFDYYMRNHNRGRNFVLAGFSQGAHMANQLLEEKFDDDEQLQSQLISALLVGGRDHIYVPPGQLVGGNLQEIPLCSSPTEVGCVIAYDPYAADVPASKEKPAGMLGACVNPASFDATVATMAALRYHREGAENFFPDDVTTDVVSYPRAFTSQCVVERLLVGVVPDDPRFSPDSLLSLDEDGDLHGFSAVLTNADLVNAIEVQAAHR